MKCGSYDMKLSGTKIAADTHSVGKSVFTKGVNALSRIMWSFRGARLHYEI